MSGSLTQFGIGKETTYGTAVAVTKFYEIISEDLTGKYERIQAEGLSASFADRGDRWTPNGKGAAGAVTLEPLSSGFNHWLRYLMGDVTTSGPTETSVYTHEANMASLHDDMLTVQVGRSTEDGTVVPWTYEGGKVTGFEFSNSVDQTLRCNISMDFEKESNPDSPAGAYTLATNVPVEDAEVLSSIGGTIELDGSAIDVGEVSFKVDNALNVDRYYIRQGASKKQPEQDGKRQIEWSFRTPYVNNAYWEKVSAAVAAGATAEIVGRWEGLILIGSTLYPSLEVRIPVGRFDAGGPRVEGPSIIDQSFSGKGFDNGTDSPFTLTYVSTDTTSL